MKLRRFELEIFRFAPDLEEAETWETFSVDLPADATVLDALRAIQADQDPSLAFRWSCGAGDCGACGMSVGSAPALACRTPLRELRQPVRIAPMSNLPIIRDLVCELDGIEAALASVHPSRESGDRAPRPGVRVPLPEPDELHASGCIECGLCYAACPAVRRDPRFVGPMVLVRAFEVLPGGSPGLNQRRRKELEGPGGIWACGEGGECSAVCPREVAPADAIGALKLGALAGAFGLRRSEVRR